MMNAGLGLVMLNQMDMVGLMSGSRMATEKRPDIIAIELRIFYKKVKSLVASLSIIPVIIKINRVKADYPANIVGVVTRIISGLLIRPQIYVTDDRTQERPPYAHTAFMVTHSMSTIHMSRPRAIDNVRSAIAEGKKKFNIERGTQHE